MEHQVQGLVFENGEWVSRPVDVYRLIARAQQQQDTETREPISKPQNKIPKLGILSRAVFASPFIKSVLSANIRHKTLNDVVFVGEDSVHIKEIQAYGHLRHAATKSDFDGRILAAKVFGEARKVQVHTEYGKPWNKAAVHAERRSFSADETDAFPPEIIVLTISSRTLMFLWARQTQTATVSFHQRTLRLPAGTSRHDRLGSFLAVDPKCRAIAVAASEGRFMLYKTRPLDVWRENVRKGRDAAPIEDERLMHLQGRVMHMEFLSPAKIGDESHVVLLFVIVHNGRTKITCYDWDCKTDLSTASARAERVLIDAEDQNPSLLIPLTHSSDCLLVCKQHITLYRNILSGMPARHRSGIPPYICPPRRPGDGISTPLWVQWDKAPRNPAFSKEAFYIAREDGMVIYSELNDESNTVETTEAGVWPYPLDKAFATLDVDISPMALSYPDVLIAAGAASDGHLCKVGAYPTQYNHQKPYHANNTFTAVESIPNWAPITDLTITRLPGVGSSYGRERGALFIANGRAPHGTISELRRGLNAPVDIPTKDLIGMTGCTGLWVLDFGSITSEDEDGERTKQYYAVILITIPPASSVIRVSRVQRDSGSVQGGSWSNWEEGEWTYEQIQVGNEPHQGNNMSEHETISACLLGDEFTLQVTHSEARILRRPNLLQTDLLLFSSLASEGNANVLVAATGSQLPCLAVVFREGYSKIILEVISVSEQGTFGKTIRHELDSDPTCLELLDIHGIPHVFVGKSDSSFVLFRIQEDGVLFAVYGDVLDEGPTNGLRMLCESALLLKSGETPVIVCGTRNGFLLSIFLRVTDERYDVLSTNYTRMGNTAAKVTRSATDSSAAFVACGSDICRIRCSQDGSYTIDVDSIWFTDSDNPGYKQSPITAIDQLPFTSGAGVDKDLGGFIFTVSGDSMLFAQLDYDIRWSSYDAPSSHLEQQKAIPRKLITTATPTKLMYMEKLNKMVVATVEAKEERAPFAVSAGYRIVHSTLQVLKLGDDEDQVKQEDEMEMSTNNLVASEFALKHYERVYSMIEWTFVDGRGKMFHFVVVGTGVTGDGHESGRRLFLNVNEKGIRLKKESPYEHPVRCMALYDENRLITVVGRTISFEEYDNQAMKWIRRGHKDLTSPGVHLTISRPFIYVSTAHDSHICYEVVPFGDPQHGRIDFKQVFTDSRQRLSAHHLVVSLSLPSTPSTPTHTQSGNMAEYDTLPDASPLPSTAEANNATIVLVTDKTCNVTGLYHPEQATHKSATDTLFEACLPRSITRLQRGDIRPPWRRPCTSYSDPFPQPITGVVADDIIGTATDGAVYAFSILSHAATRLLKLLQNIIEEKGKRSPETTVQKSKMRSGDLFDVLMNGREGEQAEGLVSVRDVDPVVGERGPAGPRGMAVDGDMLFRYFEDGDLRTLVEDGTEVAVGQLFHNLVRDVRAEAGTENMGVDADEGSNLAWAERWVRDVLMPVL